MDIEAYKSKLKTLAYSELQSAWLDVEFGIGQLEDKAERDEKMRLQFLIEAEMKSRENNSAKSIAMMLNRAFLANPEPILTLCLNRIPCNHALANDPAIVVDELMLDGEFYAVGLLGILNGALAEIGCDERVAMSFSEPEEATNGRRRVIGFCTVDAEDVVGSGVVEGEK